MATIGASCNVYMGGGKRGCEIFTQSENNIKRTMFASMRRLQSSTWIRFRPGPAGLRQDGNA